MTTILFVHGILGHPGYFDFLLPLVPQGIKVEKILLKGHGGTPHDFSQASMSEWKKQVDEAVGRLRKEGPVMIVAHSMGTLFAIEQAVSGKADKVFLLNPPLKLRLTRRLLTNPLKVVAGRTNDKWSKAAKEAYSISDDKNLFHYIGWIPRYLELFKEIIRIRSISSQLKVASFIYFSSHDEMISPKAENFFLKEPDITIRHLPDSGHYLYSDADRAIIEADFATTLSKTE